MRSSSVAIGAATLFVAASALVSLASDRDGVPARTMLDGTLRDADWALRGSDTPAEFETPAGVTHTARLKL